MEPFLSQVMIWANNFTVRGWARCDGQLLPISQNTALFSLMGTTFGGDGRVTFALPDVRGRVPVHPGTGTGLTPIRAGDIGGATQVSLTTLQLPSHTHTATANTSVSIPASGAPGTTTDPSGNAYAETSITIEGGGQAAGNIYAPSDGGAGPEAPILTDTVTIENTGGDTPHNNMQPYVVINYLIALQGIFPSRS